MLILIIIAYLEECTEKTTLEEWGPVYVGVRAAPAPPHILVLFSRLTFFQWGINIFLVRLEVFAFSLLSIRLLTIRQ